MKCTICKKDFERRMGSGHHKKQITCNSEECKKELAKINQKKWYQRNKELTKERAKRWREDNREKALELQRKRRYTKANGKLTITYPLRRFNWKGQKVCESCYNFLIGRTKIQKLDRTPITHCFVCGSKFTTTNRTKTGSNSPKVYTQVVRYNYGGYYVCGGCNSNYRTHRTFKRREDFRTLTDEEREERRIERNRKIAEKNRRKYAFKKIKTKMLRELSAVELLKEIGFYDDY